MRVRSTISPLGFSYLRARDIYFVISVHLFYPPQCLISSVQFSRSVVSDSLRPHELQHARLPVHHQLPESTQTHVRWVRDAIQPSHSVVPFSSCPQSFPASGSFQMSHLFTSGGLSIGVSASTSVLCVRWPKYCSVSFSISPSNEYSGLISLQSKGLSKVFSNTTVQKHQFFGA